MATVSEKSINDSALDENFLKSCLSKTTGTKIKEKSKEARGALLFPVSLCVLLLLLLLKNQIRRCSAYIDLAVVGEFLPDSTIISTVLQLYLW